MEQKRTTKILSRDQFRDFGHNASTLHEQGYNLPHEVVFKDDDTFEVTIVGEHDWDALDDMMEE